MKKGLETYVALLRGINVGGNSLIKMSDLKLYFENAGYKNVRTYINSGNVIFQGKPEDTHKLETKLEKILALNGDCAPKVMVRNFEQMEALVKSIPRDWDGGKERRFNVLFLKKAIDSKEILEGLNPKAKIEEVVYEPGVLFWSAQTSDLTKTSMVKLSAQKIYQDITVRNFNTIRKVFELMQSVKELE